MGSALSGEVAVVTNEDGHSTYSSVAGQIRMIQFGHSWSIGNFRSCCARLKTGEAIVSPIFRSGVDSRQKWRLVLYPNGDCTRNEDYVSVYLQLMSTDDDNTDLSVKSTFTLAIINSKREIVNKHQHNRSYYFIKDRTLWGYGRFINRAQLFEESRDGRSLLHPPAKYGRLTLLCEKVEGTNTSEIPAELNLLQISLAEGVRRAASDMEGLLRSGRMSDVSIAPCDGEPVPAHRAILAARSPFFAAMFEHDMRERDKECVHLPDLRRPILQEMLRFIYGGRVLGIEDVVYELIIAADKYVLEDLKVICEDYLIKHMSVENVVDLLILADMHNAERLKSRAHAFIIENSKDIVEKPRFKEAVDSHPRLIAEVFENMVKKN